MNLFKISGYYGKTIANWAADLSITC